MAEVDSIHKFSFRIECEDTRLGLPEKLVIGRDQDEAIVHVVLKALGFLIFFRERLQIGGHLFNDNIPFVPDLLQLDYEGHPLFWAECGESDPQRLKKIVAKAPRGEVWWLRERQGDFERMSGALKKAGVRPGRVRMLAFPDELVDGLCQNLAARNEVYWMPASFEPPALQFDFNSEWIESDFALGDY